MKNLLTAKNRLIASLGLGLCLAFGLWLYLKKEERRINSHFTMTTVLMAKKYIPLGKILTSDYIDSIQIPVAYLEPSAFQNLQQIISKEGKFYLKTRVGILK